MPRITGSTPSPVLPAAPEPKRAPGAVAPGPVATPTASPHGFDGTHDGSTARLLGSSSVVGSSGATHGSLMDKVRAFAGLFDAVPRALAAHADALAFTSDDAVAHTAARSDAQLAALPVVELARLADELVGRWKATDLLQGTQAKARTTQLARLLAAHGTAPGATDAIVSMMGNASELPAQLEGPDKERVLALLRTPAATPGDWSAFERYLDAATGSVSRPGSAVKPLFDGKEAFAAAYAAIDGAKSSIDLTMYAFHTDATGWEFARKLAAAADRGCEVRVLIDPIGSVSTGTGATDPKLLAFLKEHGVQTAVYGAGALGNRLNHRKILVVDGSRGFTGGMNIGDDYSAHWHDTHLELSGPAVAGLHGSFLAQWRGQGGGESKVAFAPPAASGRSAARVISHTGNEDRNLQLAYLRAIDTAQSSIRIANPYLTDPEVMNHLIAAAKRGVKVQLVLPAINDAGMVHELERSWYQALNDAGAEVFEYPDRMAHEKVATFDGKVSTIGSSNLDARSLLSNDECNVWSADSAVAAELDRRLFDADIAVSTRITEYRPGIFGKVWDSVLRQAEGLL